MIFGVFYGFVIRMGDDGAWVKEGVYLRIANPPSVLFHRSMESKRRTPLGGTIWCLCGLLPALGAAADTTLNIPGHRLVWYDEFQGDAVDTDKWKVNVGANVAYRRASDGRWVEPHWFDDEFEPWLDFRSINDERQYYSPGNVTAEDGLLRIRADRETVTDPVGWYDPGYHLYTSGKLNTAEQFQFRFGIVRISAKMPEGQGLWPALWMLNAPDPWFWDDEIDIMEGYGSQPTVTTSARHYKLPDGSNTFDANGVDTGRNLQTTFNVYSLDWNADSLRTGINGTEVLVLEHAIPQDPMFLIMNAAVGGMFDGNPTPATPFPTYFEIDWVRVWQPASTPTDLANGGFEDHQGPQWANWNTLGDGNLSVVAQNALHGSRSVRIAPRGGEGAELPPPPQASNWLTDGTAGPWSGWLNELSPAGGVTSGGSEDIANIPATAAGDEVTLPIHQSAQSPRANAVVFRQLAGADTAGRSLAFSGTVTINEPFPADAEAIAFIRIFDDGFDFTDVAVSIKSGGDFRIEADIPESGVPIVQVGVETTGATGAPGSLTATALFLEDEVESGDGAVEPTGWTGFFQTVMAAPGQTVRYGLVAGHDPADPVGPGAEGRLRLEFFDANEMLLGEVSTLLVDAESPGGIAPYVFEAATPAGAVYARLLIERVAPDAEADEGGSFLADAAFLFNPAATEMPVVTALHPSAQSVASGATVSLAVTADSPTEVSYQWYRNGEPVGTGPEHSFTATDWSGGTYYVIATNEAGPVVAAVSELSVLPASDELRVADFELTEERITFTFISPSGFVYQVKGSPDLVQWEIIGATFLPDGHTTTVTRDIPAADPPIRFFRVVGNR